MPESLETEEESMVILRAEHLVRYYGKGKNRIYALNDVSFSMEKGSFVSVVGTSGSGKSTLLHIVGTVDRPNKGKVFVDDNDLFSLRRDKLAIYRRRHMGIIYQFNNLLPNLTVKENILLPVLLDGREVNAQYYAELIDILELRGREKFYPHMLSGGQKQRVSIGRAMINTPDVLLADEPTGSLDARNTQEILQLLKRSNREFGQTILLITHDEQVALQTDRVLYIEHGQLVNDEQIK